MLVVLLLLLLVVVVVVVVVAAAWLGDEVYSRDSRCSAIGAKNEDVPDVRPRSAGVEVLLEIVGEDDDHRRRPPFSLEDLRRHRRRRSLPSPGR